MGKQRFNTLNLASARVELPINWTYEDQKRFRRGHFSGGSEITGGSLCEREAKALTAETGSGYSHSVKELSLLEEPLDNFPKELMAPVLRLHELARAEAAEDEAARKEE